MREPSSRAGNRARRRPIRLLLSLLVLCAFPAAFFVFFAPKGGVTSATLSDPPELLFEASSSNLSESSSVDLGVEDSYGPFEADGSDPSLEIEDNVIASRSCATVEEMGAAFAVGSEKESLRVRKLIEEHFQLNGPSRVRSLPPEQFCKHGFVIARTTQAGFGNEMYKILTAGALSIMLNRSLIIGKDRNTFPFKDYLRFSNKSFTLGEVKSLWGKKKCKEKYGRTLTMRVDHFLKPAESNVICSDWTLWKHPIILFDGATDAMAGQFFLKNVHPTMKNNALKLFGNPESVHSRPNVFGELMRALVAPSEAIEEIIQQVLRGGKEIAVTLHARMMSNRSVRAIQAALGCIRQAMPLNQLQSPKYSVVLVSDTPSFVREISHNVSQLAKIIRFDYKAFQESLANATFSNQQPLASRARDWGPSPRWVAFVDFFLGSHAKFAVISAAHRRIGTTYAQLMAALAAADQLREIGERSSEPGFKFKFLSSIHSNLLERGLSSQAGWGHAWSRFGGRLSCHRQHHQCAATPLMPPAWWDGPWQSPTPRDVRRLKSYGVYLSEYGQVLESSLHGHCNRRKDVVRTSPI
ncbi:uncharacterized protein LOC144705860 [Wolffia australiana]